MLWTELEERLVSLRSSLHQQILGTSGKQACLRLGSHLYQTPRACFMITMRYCLHCKCAYYFGGSSSPPMINFQCLFFHLDLLQYLSQSQYLKGVDMYVSIIKAYTSHASPERECVKRWVLKAYVSQSSLFLTHISPIRMKLIILPHVDLCCNQTCITMLWNFQKTQDMSVY